MSLVSFLITHLVVVLSLFGGVAAGGDGGKPPRSGGGGEGGQQLTRRNTDNVGKNAELVHPQTIVNVTNAYPRLKWSQCFAHTIGQEMELKPWAHTSHLGEKEFKEGVLGNTLMEPFE